MVRQQLSSDRISKAALSATMAFRKLRSTARFHQARACYLSDGERRRTYRKPPTVANGILINLEFLKETPTFVKRKTRKKNETPRFHLPSSTPITHPQALTHMPSSPTARGLVHNFTSGGVS